MCGIAGIISKSRRPVDESLLFEMADSLAHRGPDDEQFITIDSAKSDHKLFRREDLESFKGDIGFAHRRLSIIDLSDTASQPMSDEDKRFWIVYNGEIFNYIEIRQELIGLGYRFFTHSDTEVILKAYMEWGKDTLSRFNGMWAFVIYDAEKNLIFAARDRFGIKPFYYHVSNDYISFASEIKALLRLPWITSEAFLPAIKDYLYFSRVNTSDFTFFKDIWELEAGYYAEIDLSSDFQLKTTKWWHLAHNLSDCPVEDFEKQEKFRELLLSSIKLRLRSDVPVGTCLSGGLDSSAVVSLAHPYLEQGKQKTFSVVHPGSEYDESQYIDKIVDSYNLISHKITLEGRDLIDDLDRLIAVHDEPFTSTSMYAQWKVFKLAKESGVTVSLDGQGADELLAGYSYFKLILWAELLQKFKIFKYFRETSLNSSSLLDYVVNPIMAAAGFLSHRKMIACAGMRDPQYRSRWINDDFFLNVPLSHAPIKKIFSSRLNQRLYEVFSHDGLPALLRYADRNSMSHGLESRMPFLDYRFVAYVFSLPPQDKLNNGLSKDIMRKALNNDIPSQVLMRQDKIGFETPESRWFRGELFEWSRDIIHSNLMAQRGFYEIEILKKMLKNHHEGKINVSRPLWRAINLELWHRKYFD